MSILLALLPGLYLALLAFLLDRAVRRWWEPVPWRVWAAAALALLALFAPALLGGRVLLSGDIVPGLDVDAEGRPVAERLGNPIHLDVVTQIVPLEAAVRRALRSGAWPQWNAGVGAGMPLLADPQSQALQPLVAVAWPLPLAQALVVTAALRVLLPLLTLFVFLRRLGLSEGAALLGAISFALSGSVLLWLGWPMANAAAWLPAVLYALLLTAERGLPRDFLLLTATACATLLGGHPETILYVALTAALVGGRVLVARDRGRRAALAARWLLCAGVALGVAAPALVPAARYLPQTHRNAIVERRNALLFHGSPQAPHKEAEASETKEAPATWRRLGESFAPWRAGRRSAPQGESNRNENAMGFAGTLAWIGAILALFPARRRLPLERLFLFLALFSLAVAARPPGVERLFVHLPFFARSATWHHRLLLLTAFSVAVVAACLVHRLLSERQRRLPHLLALIAGVELFANFRGDNPSLPRGRFYPTPPAVAFLQTHSRPGERVAGLGDRLWPNTALLYGLSDARISNPMKPYSFTQAMEPLVRSTRDIEDLYLRPEHPLYQLLGVRFVLAPPKLHRSTDQRAVYRDPTIRIFERERVLDRLFLPLAAETSAKGDAAAWLASNLDFAARALVPASPGHPTPWQASRPDESRLDTAILGPARVQAHLLLAEERLLASSVYQDGGWSILIDGAPSPTLLANGPFLAAWVPAGEHRLEALYRAPGLVVGVLCAAMALAVGATLWVPRPARGCVPTKQAVERGTSE